MEELLSQLQLSEIRPEKQPEGLQAATQTQSYDCGRLCDCNCDCGYCPCSHCKCE